MWRFLYTHRTHGYQSSGTLRFSLLSDALRQQATRSFTTTRALLCRAGSGKSRSSANSAVEAPPTEEVWELWNEGNLYRLTLAQLQAFLVRNGVTVDSEWKKTALVKQVEGILKADNPSAVAAAKSPAGKEPTASNSTEGGVDAVADGSSWAMEREYAFHGANTISELGFPEAAGEFVDVQQAGLYSSSDGAHLAAMVPRAFQLIHQDFTPDMLISRINTTAFPSGNAESTAFTVLPSHAKTANRARFQKALQWCVANVWNLNLEGEVHVNFGKLLLWHQPPPPNGEGKDLALSLASSPLRPRHLSKASQMSLWSAQQLMQGPELPYSWLNVVHASSEADLAAHCERVGYEAVTSVPQADTSKCVTYRCNVRRQTDFLEGEVRQVSPESPLEMVSLNAAWERFLVTYHLRTTMPDARIQLRARPALKKKTLEQFQDLVILRPAKDLSVATVESAVPPELGEVTFAVQRQTRSWRRPSNTPQTMLQLNSHITRVALVKNKLGVFETTLREPRWEAELIVVVPPQHTRLDLNTLSEEIWAEMTTLCEVLETSTKAYGCTPVL